MRTDEANVLRHELYDAVNRIIDHHTKSFDPKITYRIGQRFDKEFSTYLLTQVAAKKVALIELSGGNRYREAVEVNDVCRITSDELRNILGFAYQEFTLQS